MTLAVCLEPATVCRIRWFTEIGGLLSYGIDSNDMFHRAGSYVDRILKGERSAAPLAARAISWS
jgi:ABC-type uncharacterized transport system substrate-binding protein